MLDSKTHDLTRLGGGNKMNCTKKQFAFFFQRCRYNLHHQIIIPVFSYWFTGVSSFKRRMVGNSIGKSIPTRRNSTSTIPYLQHSNENQRVPKQLSFPKGCLSHSMRCLMELKHCHPKNANDTCPTWPCRYASYNQLPETLVLVTFGTSSNNKQKHENLEKWSLP